MRSGQVIPFLLSLLVGLLLSFVGWGFWRSHRGQKLNGIASGMRDEVMLGLLVLAAFSLGIFLAYALLGL
jgi:hypothetical protein